MIAAFAGNARAVETLLEAGADKEKTGLWGWTALNHARVQAKAAKTNNEPWREQKFKKIIEILSRGEYVQKMGIGF